MGNSIGDPTICFIVLSCIQHDNSWAQAKDITPILARMLYILRAVFLFNFHFNSASACVRERHSAIKTWLDSDQDSTFQSVCSLQQLASSVAYTQMSLPQVYWNNAENSEFTWDGSKISLELFQEFSQDLLRRVQKIFMEKVFLGVKWRISGHISDSLTNTRPGYSFMNDPRNDQQIDRRAFLNAIMDSPNLRDEFFTGLSADGTPIFNKVRAKDWLRDYSKALLYLMTGGHVLAGSPSRGTELTGIQLRNTPHQSRGVYSIGSRIVTIARYSKKSSKTGRDTLIPHALDAISQEIVKVVVFRTHPFAQHLVRVLFPDRDDILSLWSNHLYVNFDCLFTTDNISHILQEVSQEKMGISLGVRSYRHLSVFIRRAHCSTMQTIFGLRDEEDPGALQAGHSLATEERLYGVSAGYLGQLPENMVEPYIRASTQWQTFLKIPEGGKNFDIFQDLQLQKIVSNVQVTPSGSATDTEHFKESTNTVHVNAGKRRKVEKDRFVLVDPGQRRKVEKNISSFCTKFRV